jgi:hypothetical protein
MSGLNNSNGVSNPQFQQVGEDDNYFGYNIDAESIEGILNFDYNSEELRIPFFLEGISDVTDTLVGIIVFIDGYPQKFQIEYQNGKRHDGKIMQEFHVDAERKEFDIILSPNIGKAGEKLELIVAEILRPDYQPQSKTATTYAYYHTLLPTTDAQITYYMDAKYQYDYIAEKNVTMNNFSQEFIYEYETTGRRIEAINDDNTKMTGELSDDPYIISSNNTLTFSFWAYGGLAHQYKTTFFINHAPVKINGCDYLQWNISNDELCKIEIPVDLLTLTLTEYNTIYAISVADDAPINSPNGIVKTASKLLYKLGFSQMMFSHQFRPAVAGHSGSSQYPIRPTTDTSKQV